MKFLAIDYGLRRTGIAVSDPNGSMAFPRKTIIQNTREQFFAELLACIEEEKAEAIVVGLPLLLNGEESTITKQVRNFTARLRRRSPLPVYFTPEAFSSCEASAELREAGLSFKESEEVVDQQAAVCILRSFLSVPQEYRQEAPAPQWVNAGGTQVKNGE